MEKKECKSSLVVSVRDCCKYDWTATAQSEGQNLSFSAKNLFLKYGVKYQLHQVLEL